MIQPEHLPKLLIPLSEVHREELLKVLSSPDIGSIIAEKTIQCMLEASIDIDGAIGHSADYIRGYSRGALLLCNYLLGEDIIENLQTTSTQ